MAKMDVQRERLALDDYLDLYRAIGGPWRWDQRVRMPPAQLASYLDGDACAIQLLRRAGRAIGFCEFDLTERPIVQLMNFGLLAEFQGRGWGRALLQCSLARAFADGAREVWLHTDGWDHPAALALYLQVGFVVERTELKDPTDL